MDLDSYYAARRLDDQSFRAACYAPYVGLTFDVFGYVSVCGFTRATPLGRVGETPLVDMWNGAVAGRIRDAVRTDDLGPYCTRCAEEIAGGNVHGLLATGFDWFPANENAPWPTRLEFALSNTCNLQCTMCSGDFSSTIRSRREGLPPLPSAYTPAFIDELEPFLPTLREARFLGGEPFLSEMNFRIWERMIEVGSTASCNVTTNGTQWSPRIEAVLDQLPFTIAVSLDGVRPETIEAIRVGASYDRLMENLQRFMDYCARRGTQLGLTYCLMTDNWREFGDYLLFGEERGCQVYVNTVRQPLAQSLYQLPTDELARVVETLQNQKDDYSARLERNRDAWLEQIERLTTHLDERLRLEEGARVVLGVRSPARTVWSDLLSRLVAAESEDDVRSMLGTAADPDTVRLVRIGHDDQVAGGDADYLGVDLAPLHGARTIELNYAVLAQLGSRAELVAEETRAGSVARVVDYGNGADSTRVASVIRRDGSGTARLAGIVRARPVAGYRTVEQSGTTPRA